MPGTFQNNVYRPIEVGTGEFLPVSLLPNKFQSVRLFCRQRETNLKIIADEKEEPEISKSVYIRELQGINWKIREDF